MMNGDFLRALEQIEKEKGIPIEILIETVEAALVSAYKKNFGAIGDVRVDIDQERGQWRVFARRQVVAEPDNPHAQVSLAEAQQRKPDVAIGDWLDEDVTPENFGRIAAQTAKQVLVQRIREAEREIVFDEFSARAGEVVTGEVQRKDNRNVFISLGRVEALLPPREQVPNEAYRFGDRLKVLIVDVRKTTKSPQVVVSRSHPDLLKRLFELEVPEVEEGIVEIKSIAREAGARSKVAVASRDPQVDAVGACVGHRGARVQAIVDELDGEKIDIVRWAPKIEEYLASALSPAKVSRVIASEQDLSATVIVPDNQLSLAIGRRGQNVRLAARLTGWKIDIRSEAQYAEQLAAELEAAMSANTEKVRVYELAQELDMTSKELLEVLAEQGIEAASHSSTITGAQANQIRALLQPKSVEQRSPADVAAALKAAITGTSASEPAQAEAVQVQEASFEEPEQDAESAQQPEDETTDDKVDSSSPEVTQAAAEQEPAAQEEMSEGGQAAIMTVRQAASLTEGDDDSEPPGTDEA